MVHMLDAAQLYGAAPEMSSHAGKCFAWLLPPPGPLMLQDKLVRTVVANYILWPAAHLVNFRFVPSEQRILFNNCVSVSAQLP